MESIRRLVLAARNNVRLVRQDAINLQSQLASDPGGAGASAGLPTLLLQIRGLNSGGASQLQIPVSDLRQASGPDVHVVGIKPRWFWEIAPLEDNAFVLLRTGGGQVASLHTSWTQWRTGLASRCSAGTGMCGWKGSAGATASSG